MTVDLKVVERSNIRLTFNPRENLIRSGVGLSCGPSCVGCTWRGPIPVSEAGRAESGGSAAPWFLSPECQPCSSRMPSDAQMSTGTSRLENACKVTQPGIGQASAELKNIYFYIAFLFTVTLYSGHLILVSTYHCVIKYLSKFIERKKLIIMLKIGLNFLFKKFILNPGCCGSGD